MVKSLYISYNAITEPIVQSQVIPYLKELAKGGIEFYLLTFEKTRMKKEDKCRIREDLKKKMNLNWFSLNYHKTPTAPATVFDVAAGFVYASYITLRRRIDVIHARATVAGLMAYPVVKLFAKKFIFDMRGIDSEEYVDAGSWKRGGLKYKVVSFLETVLIKSADHVVVLTERFLKVLKDKYENNEIEFSVIPCAVDMARFDNMQNKKSDLAKKMKLQDKFVVVYIGSLGTWYMLEAMLDFFRTVIARTNNAHFLILTQTDKAYARDKVKRSGIDAGRITIDSVAHDSVPGYLSMCDTGIFFIRPLFSKLSSSPVKFGEYLASGLPVVINRGVGDTERIVEEEKVGVVLKNFDKTGYHTAFNKLKELFNDKNLRGRCRDAANEFLSLENAVGSYRTIYTSLNRGKQ